MHWWFTVAELLLTLGLMIFAGAVIALIAKRLHQPVIVGYVLAGIALGPALLGWVATDAVSFISEIGLIFLMFIIGLELDLSKLKDVGKTSVLIGTIQVLFVTLVLSIASLVFGFSFIEGLYIGLAVSFSSTLIVVKTLTDLHEIDSLHGELALGVLIIQDVLAVIGLSLLGALGTAAQHISFFGLLQEFSGIYLPESGLITFGMLLANFALFSLLTYFFAKYVMPRFFKEAVTSSELLFIVTLAVVTFLSAIAGFFAFSLAIGAFLAGIALSTATYSHEIVGRVKPLKDFFLILFFVGLGMQITFGNFVNQWTLIIFLLIGTLALKPVVTFFILKLFKYNNRTSFMVSLHLAQIGEFGMVLIASGIAKATVSTSTLTGIVLVTIFTMTLTVYVIKYDEQLYQLAKPLLAPLDLAFGTRPEEHRNMPEKYQPEIVFLGINATTAETIELLHKKKKRILVVDYNISKILNYKNKGIPTICSDAMNPDVYKEIDFRKTQCVVSVVHEHTTNLFILKKIHEQHKIPMVMTAATDEWGKKLYHAGATLVLVPDLMERRMLTEVMATEDPATIRNVGRVYQEELYKNFVYIKEI